MEFYWLPEEHFPLLNKKKNRRFKAGLSTETRRIIYFFLSPFLLPQPQLPHMVFTTFLYLREIISQVPSNRKWKARLARSYFTIMVQVARGGS
jgi:hypothetical protein